VAGALKSPVRVTRISARPSDSATWNWGAAKLKKLGNVETVQTPAGDEELRGSTGLS
jgi:hypothetical protein